MKVSIYYLMLAVSSSTIAMSLGNGRVNYNPSRHSDSAVTTQDYQSSRRKQFAKIKRDNDAPTEGSPDDQKAEKLALITGDADAAVLENLSKEDKDKLKSAAEEMAAKAKLLENEKDAAKKETLKASLETSKKKLDDARKTMGLPDGVYPKAASNPQQAGSTGSSSIPPAIQNNDSSGTKKQTSQEAKDLALITGDADAAVLENLSKEDKDKLKSAAEEMAAKAKLLENEKDAAKKKTLKASLETSK
ncbi:hypothetical protein AYI68_g4874, partial [Smittium mucronatum]